MRVSRVRIVALIAGMAALLTLGSSLPPAERAGVWAAFPGGCGGKRSLGEDEARARGAEIATRHLAGMTFRSATGQILTPPAIGPAFWLVVEKKSGRWRLSHDPPAGFYMAVSFALDGSDPVVERVGFADV